MLSVSPISSVNFRGDFDLGKPGKYTRTDAAQNTTAPASEPKDVKKKKSKILPTIIGLAVIAAGLAAMPKLFPNVVKSLPKEDLANAGLMKKIGHYAAIAGEAISKYTYESIMKLFNKSKAAA